MSVLKKVDSVLERAIKYFCTVLFAGIILVVFFSVIFRYVLNSPLVWAEEVTRFLSIWLILLGSSVTIRADGHTSIDIVQMLIKKPNGRAAWFVVTHMIAAGSMIVLFPYTIEMMRAMGMVRAAATGIPMWVVYLSFPIGIVCMVVAWISSVPGFARIVKRDAEKDAAERLQEAEKKNNTVSEGMSK